MPRATGEFCVDATNSAAPYRCVQQLDYVHISPGEESSVDGHMLLALVDDGADSECLLQFISDIAEQRADPFPVASVPASACPRLCRGATIPALLHMRDGRVVSRAYGLDDSIFLVEEFVLIFKCKK